MTDIFPRLCIKRTFPKYDNHSNNVLRLKLCKQFLDWLSKNTACSSCQDALHVRKGREKKRKMEENKENENICIQKEPKKDVIVVNNQQDKKVLHVQERVNTEHRDNTRERKP